MYVINIQLVVDKSLAPKASLMRTWAKKVLGHQKVPSAEITLRIVDKDEMKSLNATYRHKNKPTNVLSFPYERPKKNTLDGFLLGDIVICAEVVQQEAQEQNKLSTAHWAHMITHGILHLLGYDHEKDHDAKIMETIEVAVLQSLGFEDPYQSGVD